MNLPADNAALIELLRSLSTKLGAYHPTKLSVAKVVPRSFPLLEQSSITDVELLVKGHSQPLRLTLIQVAGDPRAALLTSNLDALTRAFARESGERLREALHREDVDTLAYILGEAVRSNVVPPDLWLAPQEGVIANGNVDSWFPKESSDDSQRFPADRHAFDHLVRALQGPRWDEHDHFVFSRMDIVHGDFALTLLAIRDFTFAFTAANPLELISESHRDFVELIYEYKKTPSDDVASAALLAPSSLSGVIQIPDLSKEAHSRFDRRWEWLLPYLVSRDAVSFTFRVEPDCKPEPIDERRAVRLADAWRQRLELPHAADRAAQLAEIALAADTASGERLVEGRFGGMRVLCPFSLRLLVEVYFGEWPDSRSWSGLLGPTRLTCVTRKPKAIAELLMTEPYWALTSEGRTSEPPLLTLLAATFSPAPMVKDRDSNGVLDAYTLGCMDVSDNARVWVPQDMNAWRYLRQHIVEPRIFTEASSTPNADRIVRVDYVFSEMAERREDRLALVDFDRHELKVDRETGAIEGRISLLAPLVCTEPTRPTIGRPFVVDGELITAKAVNRDDW